MEQYGTGWLCLASRRDLSNSPIFDIVSKSTQRILQRVHTFLNQKNSSFSFFPFLEYINLWVYLGLEIYAYIFAYRVHTILCRNDSCPCSLRHRLVTIFLVIIWSLDFLAIVSQIIFFFHFPFFSCLRLNS